MSDAPRQLSEDEFRKIVMEGLAMIAGLLRDLLKHSEATATRVATEMATAAVAAAVAERDRESNTPDSPTMVC